MKIAKKHTISSLDLLSFLIGFPWVVLLCEKNTSGFFGVMLSLWVATPLVLNIAISVAGANFVRNASILRVLPTAIYVGWVIYGLNDIYVEHVDAQSGMALFFVPIYSIPMLILAWGIVFSSSWIMKVVGRARSGHR